MSATAVAERRWQAMGSEIHVVVVGGPADLLDVAAARIEELEQRWSRFRPDSEISALNARAGTPVQVSADTVLLVQRSIEAWHVSGGSFDPTLLDALRRAGYDRSFEQLGDAVDIPPPLDIMRPGCTDIAIDGRYVALPPGMGFDAGGIGKGLAADLISAEILDAGAAGVCVNMGGDLRVRGDSPSGAGWTLAVEHPWCHAPIAMVGLWEGALATSSVLRRVWKTGDQAHHHLIDPATGASMETDLGLACVIAAEGWMAEVLTKTILQRGSERAFDLIDDGAAALAIGIDGRVFTSARFAAYLGDAQLPTTITFDQQPGEPPRA